MRLRGLLLLAALAAAVLPAAGRTRARVVRVGFVPSYGWARVEAGGVRKGVIPEWTAELAKRCGWEVRWVHTVWERAFEQLEKGEIDLVVGAASSKSRQARLLYPSTPFLLYPSYVFVRRGFQVGERGLAALEGRKIGFLRGYLHNIVLESYLRSKKVVDWTAVYYRTMEELDHALGSGKVDAALGDVMQSLKRGQAVPLIALPPIPLFTVVSPRRPDLVPGIEYATADMILNHAQQVRDMHLRNLPEPVAELPLVDTTSDPDLGRALIAVSRTFRSDAEDELESMIFAETRLERVLALVLATLSLLSVFGLTLFLRMHRHARAGLRARTNFLSLMSHEIRTPLNAVVGFAENLRRPGLSAAEVAACARGVDDSAQALLSMLTDMLDLSRMQDLGQEVKNGVCDCAKSFAMLRGMFAGRFAEKGVAFTCRLDAMPKLRFREACLNQILVNLVGSAFRLTDAGAVTCTAAVSEEDEEHVTFLLVVRDTGGGISPEALQVVFDPLKQASTIRRDTFTEGPGPGLAVVNKLVLAAGGTFDVRSAFGRGSTFVVRLPGLRICRDAVAVEADESRPGDAQRIPRTVLIVDDVPLNLKILKLHLRSFGIADIRTSGDGAEALVELDRQPADLVLSDIWMPEMDGAQLAREIVRRRPGTPVIAITADTDAASSFDLSAFQAVLTKPITADMLRRALADSGFAVPDEKEKDDGDHA